MVYCTCRVAAMEKAEAEKVQVVKAAEGDAAESVLCMTNYPGCLASNARWHQTSHTIMTQ